MKPVLVDSRLRSLTKALTWRIGGLLVTMLVAYAVTREVAFAAQMGLADTGVKFFAYYAHERFWTWFTLSRAKPPEYEI